MALVWIDGFDGYTTSYNWPSYTSRVNIGLETNSSNTPFSSGYVITGGDGSYLQYTLSSPSQTVIVGYHRAYTYNAGGEYNVLKFFEDTTCHVSIKQTYNAGKVTYKAYRGDAATLLGSSDQIDYEYKVYRWITYKVVISDTNGSISIKYDGSFILNLTGIDTRNGGTSGLIDNVYVYPGGLMFDAWLDNLHIMDGSGTSYNDHIGEHRVYYEVPNADGSYNDFTASGGNRYECVDEIPPNGDSDYVYSSTSGHKQSFSTGTISGLPSTIGGVKVVAVARKDDAGTLTFRLINKQGSSYYAGNSNSPSSSYLFYQKFWPTNPATSSAWTQSEADSCEIGVVID